MKNTKELRAVLAVTLIDLTEGRINAKDANAIVAVANSMVNSAVAEIKHQYLIGSQDTIEFLKTED